MNLKAIKTKTQLKTIITMENKVSVQYDFEKEIFHYEENKQETLNDCMIWNKKFICNGLLDVCYDNFGIAFINNEPVTVDEPFINGIKAGIDAGLNMPLEEAPVETNESAE